MEQTLQNYFAKFHPGLNSKSIQAVLDLAAEGATVPFIARYRKEKTGNLDEVQIRSIVEGNETFQEIVKRKAFLLKEIAEQNNLTDEIKKRIEVSWDLGELEEIYRPFKKKKKTKATIAREAGLDGLAQWLWDLGHGKIKDDMTMEMKAKQFINPAHKIQTYEEALKGAQDIIVERIANDADLRARVQKDYMDNGKVASKAAKGFKPNSKYDMYKEFSELVKSLFETKSSHRYMAMRRGWQEEELSLNVTSNDEELLKLYVQFATNNPDDQIGDFLANCAKVALNVYVLPSVHNEVHRILKDKSDVDGIRVFSENVRKLLLASPFGSKCVLGIDPGLRTGCKVALIDKGGNFISHTVMQILGEDSEAKAKKLFSEVLKQIQIDAVAVGNGTAGRQTEAFVRKVLKDLGKNTPVVLVNESGASVYSASDVARQEFPDLDLTVKGAISIARRLQDPLAELVKVDPKSIGVGQYQHDVNQSQLKKSLDSVVESCVNAVGVDVNTASASLLSHVSGIGPSLAQNIVEHRKTKGLFTERNEILKVTKFSAKVFEQSAGFLRISAGKVFLDSTGIHPERYSAVKDMAQDLGLPISDLVGEGAKKLLEHRTKWAQLVGEYTFDDIYKELEKPGRDPRDPFKVFQFKEDIFEVKDLKEGDVCPGIVTNVTNFGAFVDIGVHQDGLVHISELSHKFIEDPRKVVNPGDQVQVRVIKVDIEKNQIALSMKLESAPPEEKRRPESYGDRKTAEARPPRNDQRRDAGDGPRAFQKPGAGGNKPGSKDGNFNKPQQKPFNNPFANLAQLKK
ncbi:MAG: RNA-binding transcriptional accessory protein [Bdellovibrionaceae bacterium]|nr:RNA-binding transcriptional accessory protein [Pseudobdellovibrionaceae bacterium]